MKKLRLIVAIPVAFLAMVLVGLLSAILDESLIIKNIDTDFPSNQ